MPIKIVNQTFNPWQILAEHEAQIKSRHARCGACANFVGSMRDYNSGDSVQNMTLEHYPGMTEAWLENICAEASARWEILDTLIIHRVGPLLPGDTIVLTAAWAGHRAPAFEACRYLIEELKARAPFWKKETLDNGDQRWVNPCHSVSST
jgi:molybdopterin synthase catalytic subunit